MQLAGFVAITVEVNSRVAPLYRILASAAGSDPDAAALLDELTRQRQEGQRLIARSLARAHALRPELRERDAADIMVFGGGIIPVEDIPVLEEIGVAKVFTPGATTSEITGWVASAFAADPA